MKNANHKDKLYAVASGILAVGLLLAYLAISRPESFFVLINTIWVALFVITAIFFATGVLVVVGLKKEAGKIIDIFLEGSLTLIDFIEFIKLLYRRFLETLKEFAVALAPGLAISLAGIIYLATLYFYKWFGKDHDVALLTIAVTVVSVVFFSILNKPAGQDATPEQSWPNRFSVSFNRFFVDSIEIILLLFFLTLDSTKLFFLPGDLNTPLTAQIGDYDLMNRGFYLGNHFRTTMTLIIAAVVIELTRNIIRTLSSVREYYRNNALAQKEVGMNRFKAALKNVVQESKDETLRFITFTTVLIFVFLFFPRLKLMAVAITSAVSLVLDIALPERLSITRKTDDLISRTFNRLFKI